MARPAIVSSLCKSLLGPSLGRLELIEERPDLMYSIGVLAPKISVDELGELEDLSNLAEGEYRSEDNEGDANVEAPPAPWLDPTRKPSSFGMSMSCTSDFERPEFEVCLTYARYDYLGEDSNFVRVPRCGYFDHKVFTNSWEITGRKLSSTLWLKPEEIKGESELVICQKEESEVGLTIYARKNRSLVNHWTVTLLLHSEIKAYDGKYNPELEAQYNIHQPEIRVNVVGETELYESDQSVGSTEEDLIDAELYKGRGQKARGHMASVIWEDFDPQVVEESQRESMVIQLNDGNKQNYGFAPPFYWIDGDHPKLVEVKSKFFPPDVRTEFLPIINLPAPDMNPNLDGDDEGREYVAADLSQATDREAISQHLEPLLEDYYSWIERSFDPQHNPIHVQLKIRAEEALERMRNGVDFLCRDENARTAFNIANESLSLNAIWHNPNRALKWRKFQLAFALSTLESAVLTESNDRAKLDLLWVATGGGKTEAYLLIAAFVLAYRRLTQKDGERSEWQGVNVITRYTLRLLTIQQFRRTLGMITALEYLRVERNNHSVSPSLGRQPFSIGMWVGGGVSPNQFCKGGQIKAANTLSDLRHQIGQSARGTIYDLNGDFKALELLTAGHALPSDKAKQASEPAQLINCPCCQSWLSFPRGGEDFQPESEATVSWVVNTSADLKEIVEWLIEDPSTHISEASAVSHAGRYATLTVKMTHPDGISETTVEAIAGNVKRQISNSWGETFEFCSARPSRPGYFLRYFTAQDGIKKRFYDFEIRCPTPDCPLNKINWSAELPSGSVIDRRCQNDQQQIGSSHGIEILPEWRSKSEDIYRSRGLPIPAFTCDYQVYNRLPSMLIATVDKFARLPFEPNAGTLFGNVTHHHEVHGFMRQNSGENGMISTMRNRTTPLPNSLPAPELIIQDELHLIEGPLGSMVGFYETVIEELIKEGRNNRLPKYIASTATIRAAEGQVQSLFTRELNLFPPKGPTWKDRGLIREDDIESPWSLGEKAGRLYMGFCPIGVSGLGVQRDVFSNLLYFSQKLDGDRYWSLVGYFNAVKELAAGRALVEQDIEGALNRIANKAGETPRALTLVELSSRMDSSELPILLNQLENAKRGNSGCVDVLLTTSMFGTGVDITRLNLMFVGGQPKTTAQYIQATGRVGRNNGALIATYLRGSRPRDLDHYERFLSYHLQIHRYVEPVTVRPYSMAVLERAGGPLSVAWLRNSRNANTYSWASKEAAGEHSEGKPRPTEFDVFKQIITQRNNSQPVERQIDPAPPNAIESVLDQGWGAWGTISNLASQDPDGKMQWVNYETSQTFGRAPPTNTYVVLGDERHVKHPDNHRAAYGPNYATPNSLRTVDSTTGVEPRRDN